MSAPILLRAFKERCKGTEFRMDAIARVGSLPTALATFRVPRRRNLYFRGPFITMFKKIGVIREGKEPPDRRTPLTPKQCHEVLLQGIDVVVQRSPVRAYTDAEYTAQNVRVTSDLSADDWLSSGSLLNRSRSMSV